VLSAAPGSLLRSRFAGYTRAVTDADTDVAKAEEELTVLKNLAKVFQSFATKGGEEGCCPLCIRGFENQAGSYNRFLFSLTSAPSRATASGFTDKSASS